MRRGAENFVDSPAQGFRQQIAQLLALSDDEKRQICLELLDEFGAQNIKENGYELQHSCCLPFGFHRNGDQNPSANLNYQKLTYKCHGCGEGGGIAWFITVCRGGDYESTAKWLHDHTDKTSAESLRSLLAFADTMFGDKVQVPTPSLPEYDPAVLVPWRFIHPYLTEQRRIPVDNIVRFEVGYDKSQDRIVLPHYWKGRLVGWQTRQLNGEGPKYKNTPDFPKNETLYNYPADLKSHPIVVESVLSVVSKAHLVPSMIATFGASVTDRQKYLLAKFPRVTLWFDNDPAGWKATQEVGEYLMRYTDVFVVDSEWNADPADLTDEDFDKTRASVLPFSIWQQPTHLKDYPNGYS